MTLTLSYPFRHKTTELSYHGRSLLDTDALNKQCTSMILTLKALGFFLPVQHWGGVFSTPYVRLDPDILES